MIELKLDRGYIALIDDEDADLLQFKWTTNGTNRRYYVTGTMPIDGKNKSVKMHRIILERKIGRRLEKHEECDHIHGNRLDNRRSELRLATRTENSRNTKKSSRNTSGYKGVYYNSNDNRYTAQIVVNRKQIHLGRYTTAEDAYKVYCEAAQKYFGEFARLE